MPGAASTAAALGLLSVAAATHVLQTDPELILLSYQEK